MPSLLAKTPRKVEIAIFEDVKMRTELVTCLENIDNGPIISAFFFQKKKKKKRQDMQEIANSPAAHGGRSLSMGWIY